MSGKNAQNGNSVQNNANTPLNHSERMKIFRAKMAKKKQTLRVPNSGKFEHLRKFVASYKQNEIAYNKIMRQKAAQEMAQQNHEPKTETVIEQVNELKTETEVRIENNLVVEEPKAKEELPNPVDEVAKENDAEPMNLEDITVDDVDLEDPALDEELKQLEQKIKKEEELKAMGIDPNSVEEPDDPELAKEISELMQEPDEKLEGAALEEAFQSLSNEVDSEIKGSDADDHEIDDPDVDEDINRLELEIKKEESKPTEQSEPIAEEEQLIATEKPPVIPRKPIEPESIFAKNPAHKTIVPEKKSLDAKYDLRYNFTEAKLKKIFFKEGELSRGNVISEAYEENDIIEAEYDIEEIEHKINEKDTVISHRVSIPNFDDLLAQRRENQEATNQVVSMLSDILKEAGITNQQNDASLAQTVYQKLSGTMENNASLSGKDSVMHDVAVAFFDESYNALDNSGLSSVDRVVAAQRIANVMMSGYSPLGFVYGELDKYIDNYVITNSTLLERRLMENGKFSEAEAETLVDGVMSRLDDDSARLQAEFEAKYGEGLTAEDELRIYAPDFHKKYDARIDDELFAENVKKQIGDILRSSGMAKKEDADVDEETDIDEVINETVDSIYDDTVRNIRLMYDYNSVGSTLSYMTNWNYETTLKALNGGTMLPRNPIVTAQRISDVILKSYTPIAFAENGALNRYANNYIIKNKDDLKERLQGVGSYSEKEIEDILQRDLLAELRRELKEGTQMEQQNAQPQEQQAEEPQELQLEQIQEHIKKLEEMETFSFDESDPLNYESAYIKDVVSDNPQPEPLYSVSELIEMRIAHPDIYEEVNSQLNDILKSAGSVLADKPRYVGVIHDVMSKTMLSAFDADQESIDMTDVAAAFFKNAYAGINGEDWSLKDKVINAQRIADLMLKNYSPIPIIGGDIQRFADNYVLKNKEMYRTLQIAGYDEIDSLFEEVQKELSGVSEINGQANDEKESDGPLPFESFAEFCEALYVQRISYSNNVLHESVKSQMTDILKETGSSLLDDPGFIEAFHSNMAAVMHISYPLDGPFPVMEDVAVQFFANAYQFISQDNLSMKDKIITAQRLSDLALSRYSPVTFAKDERLDQYAQLFVINYAPRLKDILEAKGVDKEAIQAMEAIANEKYEPVSIPLENEQSEPMVDEQIENKENVAIQFDEITEIKVEEHKEPTLADDFELIRNNSNEPEPEAIKIVEDLPENIIFENTDEKQVNTDTVAFNPHELFQQIENNLTKTKTEQNAVVEPQPKEEPKPVYSVPPIPGMNSNVKRENVNDAPVLSKEEREAKELADAKAALDRLKNIHTGTIEERADRARMINYYQGIVNKHKSLDELFKESIELAEKARRDAKEREEREIQLKELENAEKNDIIEDEEDLSPIEKENPFMHDVVGQNRNHHNDNNAPDFEKENIGVDIRRELNDSNVIVETDEDEEIEEPEMPEEINTENNVPAVNLNANNVQENAVDIPQQEPAQQEPPKHENEKPEQEIAPNVIANESSTVETIYIPDFHDKFEARLTSDAVSEQVKAELIEIIKAAGITDDEKADTISELSYSNLREGLDIAYIRGGARPKTRDAVEACFENANLSLLDAGFSMKNRIITAQKIADVMLKNYSPITFADHKLDYYADGYLVKDDELLKKQLGYENIPEDQIGSVMQELRVGLVNGLENEQLFEISNQDRNVNTQQEENVVEAPQQNQPQQDQPEAKPEAKTETKPEVKTETKPEVKPISSEARVAVYNEKLKAYNNMYKLNIDSNNFASSVTEAWALMTSGDKQKIADGQKIMNNLFKDTLKKAFDIEKDAAYDEHRLPEYNEIIKSSNELLRSAMYGLTDMYHNQNRKGLFDATSFGGLNAQDMADLTVGNSSWSADQKSDEVWDIQSREAKNIADKWLKENKPYEKMINEMKALVEANEKGIISRKEMIDKLTAAEWLLTNNEKMMIEDPEDPLNPIPNWGNRYWKSLTETREALGIDKHTSMRDLIQNDYAAMTKAVNCANYNKMQIQLYILDPDVRELSDSMEFQKEQFATLSEANSISIPPKQNADEKTNDIHKNETRWREPVESQNEREKMKHEPKVFSNMVIDKAAELRIDAVRE